MSKIFPKQPKLTKADREGLKSKGYLNSWNGLTKALEKDPLGEDDLKKLVLIELESPTPRFEIVNRIVGKLQRVERAAINEAIVKALGDNSDAKNLLK